jgi:hypothetical protein
MTKKSDYKIIPYFSAFEPDHQKFKIITGGVIHSTHRTEKSAIDMIANLELDPWFCDRGYTRKGRSNW